MGQAATSTSTQPESSPRLFTNQQNIQLHHAIASTTMNQQQMDEDDDEEMMNNQAYQDDLENYHYLTSQSAQFSNDHISLDFNIGYYDDNKIKNLVLNMRGSTNLRSNTHLSVKDEYGNCLKMRLVGSTFILTQLGECPTKFFGISPTDDSSLLQPGCILLERGLFEVEVKSPQPFVYSQNMKLVVSKIAKKTSRNIAKYITFLFEIENLGYIVLSFGHRKCMRTSVVFATSVFVSKCVSRDCPNGIDMVNTTETARNSIILDDGPTRNRSLSQPQQRKRSAATPKPLVSFHTNSKSLELSTSTSTVNDNQLLNTQSYSSTGSQFLNNGTAYSSSHSTHMIGSPLMMPLSPSTTTSIGSISPRFSQFNSSSNANTPRYLQNYPSEFSPSSCQSGNFGQKNSSVSSSTSYCTSGNLASSVLSHPSTTSLLFDSNDRILGNSSSPRQHYLSDQYSSEFVINSNNTSPNPSPRLRTSFSSTPLSNSLYSPSTPNFPNQFEQYNMQYNNPSLFECSTLTCEFNEAGICTIINNHPEGFYSNDKISVLFIAFEPQDVQIDNGLVIDVTSKLLVFRLPVIPLSLCQLPQIRTKLFLKINDRLMFVDYFTFRNGEYDFAFRPLHNMMYQKASPSNSQVLNALFQPSSCQNNQFN